MRAIVGVDAGGSRTTVVVTDEELTELSRGEGPAAALTDNAPGVSAAVIRELVVETLHRAGASRAETLVAGVAGAGDDARRTELERHLKPVASRVRVVPDAEIALVHTVPMGPGMVLIAGTGSIAWGRGPGGAIWRAGGWGPDKGDEGSGFWLVRRAIRLGVVDDMPDQSRTEVARHAPEVLRKAPELVDEAADALAGLVMELADRYPPAPPVPVGFSGGLLSPDSPVRGAVRTRLETLPNVGVLDRVVDPALGGCVMGVSSER